MSNFSILFSTFLALFFVGIKTQAGEHIVSDSIYGLNATLVNGITYQYPYYNVGGHPFFLENKFSSETLQVNGKTFENVRLKLDILNNKLLLEYKNSVGATKQIELRDSLIQSFTYRHTFFSKHDVPKKGKKFVQKINEGKITCFYYWTKEMKVSNDSGAGGYVINRARRTKYVKYNGITSQYNSKRSFFKIFPKHQKSQIKDFIKSKKIKWRKVGDEDMMAVMNYLNQLQP